MPLFLRNNRRYAIAAFFFTIGVEAALSKSFSTSGAKVSVMSLPPMLAMAASARHFTRSLRLSKSSWSEFTMSGIISWFSPRSS